MALPGQMGPPALSPNSNFLQQASQIINDSPSSAPDLADFDSLFAVETLERAGLTLGEGDSLPLYVLSLPSLKLARRLTVRRFLDGQSLGGGHAPTEMTPFMGMEQFFLPMEIDNMLGGISNNPGDGNGQNEGGSDQPGYGENVWW